MDTFPGRKLFHPPPPPPPPPPHSSHTSFPIIAVAIIGIIATGFLLVGYYVFVIKCCLNWHRIDLLRRFSFSRRRRVDGTSPTSRSPAAAAANRGLTESAIRSIPVFKFKKSGSINKAASIIINNNSNNNNAAMIKTTTCDCAVCLNEFQEDEKLRIIPNCGHLFHIDCIDVWLQNNANCPLCRTSISSNYTNYTVQENQDPIFTDDDVVIEIGREPPSPSSRPVIPERERTGSDGLLTNTNNSSIIISHSPKILSRKKSKKLSHVWSMGDEWIDNRKKDEQFVVNQPMRRSFSMDSAADNHLYLAVQEIIKGQLLQDLNNYQVNYYPNEVCSSSSSRSIKRSFFSFGQGKGSRSAVQPVTILEP